MQCQGNEMEVYILSFERCLPRFYNCSSISINMTSSLITILSAECSNPADESFMSFGVSTSQEACPKYMSDIMRQCMSIMPLECMDYVLNQLV